MLTPDFQKKHISRAIFIFVFVVCLLIIGLLLMVDKYWVYQPTQSTAIQYIASNSDFSEQAPLGITSVSTKQVVHIFPAKKALIGVYTFAKVLERNSGSKELERCYESVYLNQHLLSGIQGYYGLGKCEPFDIIDVRSHYDPSSDSYILFGIATDDQIVSIRAIWSNGIQETTHTTNGMFAFFRPGNELQITRLIGQDIQGKELINVQVLND